MKEKTRSVTKALLLAASLLCVLSTRLEPDDDTAETFTYERDLRSVRNRRWRPPGDRPRRGNPRGAAQGFSRPPRRQPLVPRALRRMSAMRNAARPVPRLPRPDPRPGEARPRQRGGVNRAPAVPSNRGMRVFAPPNAARHPRLAHANNRGSPERLLTHHRARTSRRTVARPVAADGREVHNRRYGRDYRPMVNNLYPRLQQVDAKLNTEYKKSLAAIENKVRELTQYRTLGGAEFNLGDINSRLRIELIGLKSKCDVPPVQPVSFYQQHAAANGRSHRFYRLNTLQDAMQSHLSSFKNNHKRQSAKGKLAKLKRRNADLDKDIAGLMRIEALIEQNSDLRRVIAKLKSSHQRRRRSRLSDSENPPDPRDQIEGFPQSLFKRLQGEHTSNHEPAVDQPGSPTEATALDPAVSRWLGTRTCTCPSLDECTCRDQVTHQQEGVTRPQRRIRHASSYTCVDDDKCDCFMKLGGCKLGKDNKCTECRHKLVGENHVVGFG